MRLLVRLLQLLRTLALHCEIAGDFGHARSGRKLSLLDGCAEEARGTL